MRASEKMCSLALNRLQQAEESLDEAQFLFDGGKSLRSVINRVYYAMFYAILALLIFEPFGSSKHSAVLSYFNLHFIKNGRIPKELGRAVNKAFDLQINFRNKRLPQASGFSCAGLSTAHEKKLALSVASAPLR